MAKTIAQLFSELRPDPWRKDAAFSPEVHSANHQLFTATNPDTSTRILNDFIQKHQPCLFGKAGAALGLISYCILNESDLLGPEETLMAKIQRARTAWTREAFYGRKSGFVVSVTSQTIAKALPNDTMKELARRLCSFYLEKEIKDNEVHLEDVFLEMPGQRQTTWKWKAGVNYFCAQGDGRWWRDHRIPGGMAFSVNSVGHRVKSAKLAAAMRQGVQTLGAPEEEWDASKIDSLEKALILAMRTIANASPAVSGKATELLPVPAQPNNLRPQVCPVQLPQELAQKDFCEYKGYYHTDYTLPEEYFRPDVERPVHTKGHILDFTYLFHRSVDNPAFFAMGEGQQIRADEADAAPGDQMAFYLKRLKTKEETMRIADSERLLKALSR